jgi:hypothetical protein
LELDGCTRFARTGRRKPPQTETATNSAFWNWVAVPALRAPAAANRLKPKLPPIPHWNQMAVPALRVPAGINLG